MKQLQIFGDSIMKGVVYRAEDHKYSLCRDKLVLQDVELINRAKMGATIEYGLTAVQRHIDSCGPDTVALLEFGGNDCNHHWDKVSETPDEEHICMIPPERFTALYTETVETLQKTGARVIVSTLPPISAQKFMNYLSAGLSYENILHWLGDVDHLYRWQRHYSELCAEVAEKTGCEVLQLRDAVPAESWDSMVCGDGIHPTEEGYLILHGYMEQALTA